MRIDGLHGKADALHTAVSAVGQPVLEIFRKGIQAVVAETLTMPRFFMPDKPAHDRSGPSKAWSAAVDPGEDSCINILTIKPEIGLTANVAKRVSVHGGVPYHWSARTCKESGV